MSELAPIVEQLAPELGRPLDEPVPLDGGITNRNYRARFADGEYVIRVPGKDTSLLEIDRGAEVVANQRAARLGVAPPVAASLDDPQAIVTEFVEGRGMESPELREPERLGQVAGLLRKIHDSEGTIPADFDSFEIVRLYARTATDRGSIPPPAYAEALGHADRIRDALSGDEHRAVPCHNDLLAGNFILSGERIWIVDWEYAGMGDRYFDLANFAINNELDSDGRAALLDAYFEDRLPGGAPACLRLFMFMSDFREAMWGVVQSAVSDLDFDFGAYASKHFDRMLATAADPDFDRWLREARAAAG